ncbi:hypothetical protein, partial [Streptomyces sp. WAC 01325]|uniref:hypothetical protein n=1 Tax=Streptomyces sp. WAC 01325 TaxID=2203202 RepID=UPI001C8EDCAC
PLNSKNALPKEGGDWAPPAGLEPAAKRLEGAWRKLPYPCSDLLHLVLSDGHLWNFDTHSTDEGDARRIDCVS